MSNLENITNKILAEARQQAADMEAEARKFSDQYLAKEQDKAQARADALVDRARIQAEHKREMMVSNAKLKSRDQLLGAKQQVLHKTFEMAKTALRQLDDTKYRDFLTNTLQGLKLKGTEKLLVPADKLELVRGMGLSIDTVEAEIDSGFQIQDGQTKMIFSFDDLIDEARESMEGEIISKLFPGEA
ncbi:MAG: hypothetical protein GX978_03270 [Tissierellia bacterium]|jgi:V/A-type H+-transporting ATPase subunit E|nr:hypothetical protein [Tissierellia bacterium]